MAQRFLDDDESVAPFEGRSAARRLRWAADEEADARGGRFGALLMMSQFVGSRLALVITPFWTV